MNPVDMSEVLKSISNPARMNILQWLKTPRAHFDVDFQFEMQQVNAEEVGVCAVLIQKKSGFSQSTVSTYLANLQRAKLITSQRIGGWTYYQRNEEEIAKVTRFLQENL